MREEINKILVDSLLGFIDPPDKEMIDVATDKITTLIERESGWISVEDRLPEQIGYCLVYYCEDWNYNRINKIAWAFFNSQDEFCLTNSKVEPTHWMPLPNPPKSEEV